MNPPHAGSPADSQRLDLSGVDKSWLEPISVTAWLIPEDGYWSALAAEFNVAGMGASEEAALKNMDELLTDYLLLVAEEGGSLSDALRPIPTKLKAKLELELLREKLSRRLHSERSDRVHRLAHQAPARSLCLE
jgi:predicted RNase H-like HicB family nuclease